MYKFAKEKLVPDPAREFDNFLNYYLAKGTEYSDWEKVWMNWVNRDFEERKALLDAGVILN